MNPDDVVLVVLVNSLRDWERVTRERWYRIPVKHAPGLFEGAQYLAFYWASAFRENKWQISQYAPVRGHELVRRRDLIPEETDHPRADELYYKLQLGPLETRQPPITSKRGRRILFLWTTWEKFSAAQELNDLFHKSPAQDKLWEALKECRLDAERQLLIGEGRSRYRVDFMVYCPRGRLGITIGEQLSAAAVQARKQDLALLTFSDEELEDHFERTLDEIRARTRELGEHPVNIP